jgi:hypothetical protein
LPARGEANGQSRRAVDTPDVLVDVTYPNKSGDGRLRHPSFKGFRNDLR